MSYIKPTGTPETNETALSALSPVNGHSEFPVLPWEPLYLKTQTLN